MNEIKYDLKKHSWCFTAFAAFSLIMLRNTRILVYILSLGKK